MEKERGSAKAIQEIIKIGDRIGVEEMVMITEIVEKAGGSLYSVAPDGDRCGNGRFRIKWPVPKPDVFLKMVDQLVAHRIDFEVLINGIPVPEEILMKVSRNIHR